MIKRVASSHPDFITLVQSLNEYLAVIDGAQHAFYDQYNRLEGLKNCVLYYDNDIAVGCGALKRYDERSFEIKRMFTHPDARGKGIASKIVKELETWGKELGARRIILETGKTMLDAIALYRKLGYRDIENYKPYIGIENSLCFEKKLN